MKKILAIAIAVSFILACVLAGCGNNYENIVKEQFIKDCSVVGSATLQSFGTDGENSVIPPSKGDVSVTTVTEGEEYKADGDLTFRTKSGDLAFHCTGTYKIDEDGNAENVDWDVNY